MRHVPFWPSVEKSLVRKNYGCDNNKLSSEIFIQDFRKLITEKEQDVLVLSEETGRLEVVETKQVEGDSDKNNESEPEPKPIEEDNNAEPERVSRYLRSSSNQSERREVWWDSKIVLYFNQKF